MLNLDGGVSRGTGSRAFDPVGTQDEEAGWISYFQRWGGLSGLPVEGSPERVYEPVYQRFRPVEATIKRPAVDGHARRAMQKLLRSLRKKQHSSLRIGNDQAILIFDQLLLSRATGGRNESMGQPRRGSRQTQLLFPSKVPRSARAQQIKDADRLHPIADGQAQIMAVSTRHKDNIKKIAAMKIGNAGTTVSSQRRHQFPIARDRFAFLPVVKLFEIKTHDIRRDNKRPIPVKIVAFLVHPYEGCFLIGHNIAYRSQ